MRWHAPALKERKRELLWTLLGALAAQVLLVLYADWRWPGLYDREQGRREGLLAAARAGAPGRPLLAVVGSSRIGTDFVPEALPALRSASGEEVLPFNFSHLEAGPTFNLLQLHRLLRSGQRPRWLVLELCPLFTPREDLGLCVWGATPADLPFLLGHVPTRKIVPHYTRSRLVPFYRHRQTILQAVAPSFATEAGASDRVRLRELGGDDGWCGQAVVCRDDRQRRRCGVAEQARSLAATGISPRCRQVTREALELCRREGIAVAVLLTPEDSLLRAAYGPALLDELDGFLSELRRDFGVSVIDARGWMADEDFSDGHHLLTGAARRFTRRLAREGLRPLGISSSAPG